MSNIMTTKRAYVPLKFWKMYLIILDNLPPSVVIQLLFKEMLESFINSFILCVAKWRKKKKIRGDNKEFILQRSQELSALKWQTAG